jgi:Ca2+-binding RTX toxin-like protein
MQASKYNGIENLESRRLLSAAVLAGHTLRVTGDPAGTNTISVHYNDAGDQLEVTMNSTSVRGVVKNIDKFFPTSLGISNVMIRGSIRVDAITVGQSGKTFDIPTHIFALGGDDTITTGAENDFIDAGAGNDIVSSGDGNDTVRGGIGDDAITLGNGNDKADGNRGNDVITAGNGNDSILGGIGDDSIVVGNGADTVRGGAGNDTMTAGNGNDSLWGGLGNDSITAGNGNDTFGGILGDNTLLGGTGHNTFYERVLANNTTNYDSTKDTLVLKPNKGDSTNPSTVS